MYMRNKTHEKNHEVQLATSSARHQLTRGRMARFLECRGFRPPYPALKCLLCRLPRWIELPHGSLACGSQCPSPFPAITAAGIDDETPLLDERQVSRRRRLIDPDGIGEFGRRQV